MRAPNTVTARAFRRYAALVARWPLVFILVPLAVTAGLSLGLLRLQVDSDPNLVWVPPASTVNTQKSYFDAAFDPFFRVNQIIVALDSADVDLASSSAAVASAPGTSPARNLAVRGDGAPHTAVVRTASPGAGWVSGPGVDPGGAMSRAALMAVLNLTQALASTPDSAGTVLDDVCYKPIAGRGCLVESPLDYFRSDPAVIVSGGGWMMMRGEGAARVRTRRSETP